MIIDKLMHALQQRHAVYKETNTLNFFSRLEKLSLSVIYVNKVSDCRPKYNADLAGDFPDELAQFVNFSRVALTDPTFNITDVVMVMVSHMFVLC